MDTKRDFDFPKDREDLAHVGDFLGDVFDEVQEGEISDEMILGPSYISYAGEPPMDTGTFNMFCAWLGNAKIHVRRLTFNGSTPFECKFG
jgi:hypothetical protein